MLHTCHERLNLEPLKTFEVVLKLLEYIVTLHTLLCVGAKLSYNFTNKQIGRPLK